MTRVPQLIAALLAGAVVALVCVAVGAAVARHPTPVECVCECP
jgi:hypothetical protein